jgi:hypothetical protein
MHWIAEPRVSQFFQEQDERNVIFLFGRGHLKAVQEIRMPGSMTPTSTAHMPASTTTHQLSGSLRTEPPLETPHKPFAQQIRTDQQVGAPSNSMTMHLEEWRRNGFGVQPPVRQALMPKTTDHRYLRMTGVADNRNKLRSQCLRTIVTLILGATLTPICNAQQRPGPATGQITGTVKDTDDAVITEAVITLESQTTHEQYRSNSDRAGLFKFTALSPGTFQVNVSANGFADWIATEVVVEPGKTHELTNITLSVAPVITSVQVISLHELAVEQVRSEESQRILGIVPNYYAVYIPNAAPLSPKLKYSLALKTELDPFSVFASGAIAGEQQRQNDFAGYGQGAQGYGKRFGASYTTTFSDIILSGAVFPSLLHQDPRYFYKGTGTVVSRTLYALATTVICKGDSGRWQANYSNVLGTFASATISNLYYPAGSRGVHLTIDNSLINLAGEAVGDLAQEFFLRKLTPKANRSP